MMVGFVVVFLLSLHTLGVSIYLSCPDSTINFDDTFHSQQPLAPTRCLHLSLSLVLLDPALLAGRSAERSANRVLNRAVYLETKMNWRCCQILRPSRPGMNSTPTLRGVCFGQRLM